MIMQSDMKPRICGKILEEGKFLANIANEAQFAKIPHQYTITINTVKLCTEDLSNHLNKNPSD